MLEIGPVEIRDDHKAILRIPICEDSRFPSTSDSKVLFPVKSAYDVHVNMLDRDSVRGRGADSENRDFRNTLFGKNTDSPPKVHHFVWCFAQGLEWSWSAGDEG
jgi:hypothetical protein